MHDGHFYYVNSLQAHIDTFVTGMLRVALELVFFTITIGTLFAWREWHALVANRVLVWISLVSYNLYLWHSGILVSYPSRLEVC